MLGDYMPEKYERFRYKKPSFTTRRPKLSEPLEDASVEDSHHDLSVVGNETKCIIAHKTEHHYDDYPHFFSTKFVINLCFLNANFCTIPQGFISTKSPR